MNKFILFCLIASICCGNINKAVAYLVKCPIARENISSSKCVVNALQVGGFNFPRQASPYMYRTNGVLNKIGYKEIAKSSSFQKGDITVTEQNSFHPHGHIAMYSGSKWISDFVQKNEFVFTSHQPPVHYFRLQ